MSKYSFFNLNNNNKLVMLKMLHICANVELIHPNRYKCHVDDVGGKYDFI